MTDMSDPERVVTITLRQYMSLYRQAMELQELEMAGVDNWDGYHEIDHDRIKKACRRERNKHIHGGDA